MMSIIKDIRSGALPIQDLPSFILFILSKYGSVTLSVTFWVCFIVAALGISYLLLTTK